MGRLQVLGSLSGLLLASCGDGPPATADRSAQASADTYDGHEPGYPVAGEYHLVTIDGANGRRRESDVHLDVENHVKFAGKFFKDDGANCRDRQHSLDTGRFTFRATCDAPDGDIHNIGADVQGSFTEDRIDMTQTINLWGTPLRKEISYTRNR